MIVKIQQICQLQKPSPTLTIGAVLFEISMTLDRQKNNDETHNRKFKSLKL